MAHFQSTIVDFSRILSKAHSVALISTLKMFLYSSQFPPFNAKYPYFIILGAQSVSALLFTCSRYSLARDSRCDWPCIPSCFSFSLHELFCSQSFKRKSIPTFLEQTCLFPAFSTACPNAPRLPSTANSSKAPGPLPPSFRCNNAGTN